MTAGDNTTHDDGSVAVATGTADEQANHEYDSDAALTKIRSITA